MSKNCPRCGKTKPVEEFNKHKGSRDGLQGWCRVCQTEDAKERREIGNGSRSKEYATKYAAQWRKENHEKYRKYSNEYKRKVAKQLRLDAIEAAGGKCVACGIGDNRVLQFDHINGGGCAERKKVSREAIWRQVIRGERDDLQLLCANCHVIKTYSAAS